MSEEEGGPWGLRLKAREKILIQLCAYACDTDDGVFPFELSQKGLSEHLGLRRSHVAAALQALVEENLVEVVKGHVVGADRRLNVYCVTSKGLESANPARDRLLETEVPFEDSDGTRTVRVSEIVGSREATLASVMSQLERGGPVRGEVALVTKADKKLISVFCPTCKKQIEVDNVFFDEEVGFDCPGCGRPYRIVPAQKVETGDTAPAADEPRPRAVAAAVFAAVIVIVLAFIGLPVCLSTLVMAGVGIGLVVWLAISGKASKRLNPRTPFRAVSATLILSPALMLIWHLTVAPVDPYDVAYVLLPTIGAVVAADFFFTRRAPEFRGDFLLSAGCVMILVAAGTMFVVEFGAVDVGMALALGMAGGVFVVLSTFFPMDKDARVLDVAAAFGAFLLLLAGAVLIWAASDIMDVVGIGAVSLLGAVLITLRLGREVLGDRGLSDHLVAAALLGGAVVLVVMGVLMIDGGGTVEGAAEILLAVPFAYFGSKGVLNENWRSRLPLAAVLAAAGTVALAVGLMT